MDADQLRVGVVDWLVAPFAGEDRVTWVGSDVVTVPPVPEVVRSAPVGSDALVAVTFMAALLTPELSVTFTTATMPLLMIVAFMPVAKHV